MDKIEYQNKILFVPEFPTLPVIVGDGVGAEIWESARLITAEAVKKCYYEKRGINWLEVYAGKKAQDLKGEWLPEETLNAFNTYSAGIVGPLEYVGDNGNRSFGCILRHNMDLYACIKHFRWINGIITPIRKPENIDMYVFRENSEDIYAGIEWTYNSPDCTKLLHFLENDMRVKKIRFPRTSSFAIKPVSKEGCERIVQSALDHALKTGASKLTIVHNSKKLPVTEGSFVNWAYDLIERECGEKVLSMRKVNAVRKDVGEDVAKGLLDDAFIKQHMIVEDMVIGDFMNEAMMYPEKFDVVVTLNLDGDMIDHFLSIISGNRGLIPFTSMNNQTGKAIFGVNNNPQYNLAGLNKVNPCEMILACASLLRFMKWEEASDLIRKALERTIAQGKVTEDLTRNFSTGIKLSTKEFTQEVINIIRNN